MMRCNACQLNLWGHLLEFNSRRLFNLLLEKSNLALKCRFGNTVASHARSLRLLLFSPPADNTLSAIAPNPPSCWIFHCSSSCTPGKAPNAQRRQLQHCWSRDDPDCIHGECSERNFPVSIGKTSCKQYARLIGGQTEAASSSLPNEVMARSISRLTVTPALL